MPYTMQQRAVFEYRLKLVKAGLKKRRIKYYVPAALALDPSANAKQLNNVMSGNTLNEKALTLLEKVAGTTQTVEA